MTWPILIIEDDADVCDGLVQVLTARGYRVTAAPNGAEALAWLNQGGQPAVIVLDLMMPVMDGREVIEHLEQDPRLVKIPVVVLTAQPHMAVGLDTKVETILLKPLPLRRLLDTIESICHSGKTTREIAALRAAIAPTPAMGIPAADATPETEEVSGGGANSARTTASVRSGSGSLDAIPAPSRRGRDDDPGPGGRSP